MHIISQPRRRCDEAPTIPGKGLLRVSYDTIIAMDASQIITHCRHREAYGIDSLQPLEMQVLPQCGGT